MTPIEVVVRHATALLLPGGAVAFLLLSRRQRRRALPPAAENLALRLGLPLAPPQGEETAGLIAAGILQPYRDVGPALRWRAPDATFCAFVASGRKGPQGVVVVTPHDGVRDKPRLSAVLRPSLRAAPSLALPGDLAWRSPEVGAIRLGNRLVVHCPRIATDDDLERLIMCACAILEGEEASCVGP